MLDLDYVIHLGTYFCTLFVPLSYKLSNLYLLAIPPPHTLVAYQSCTVQCKVYSPIFHPYD